MPYPLSTPQLARCAALMAAACLAACASTQDSNTTDTAPVVAAAPTAPAPPPAPAPAAPAPAPVSSSTVSPGAAALNEGIKAFGQGEYKRSETKLLESQKLGLYQSSEQVQAHKTKAFLYCVTRRTAQCEKSFEDAFAMDKSFDLSRAERGHPVWGPVFTKVQKKQGK
jgi:hypothetical protein